jgi:hypothetical protein
MFLKALVIAEDHAAASWLQHDDVKSIVVEKMH